MFESEIYTVSNAFLAAYPASRYPELLTKQARPLECLLLDVSPDYFICIPFRSNISHKNAFMFKNSARSRRTRSGLDYTKIILVKDSSYLNPNAVVDKDEFNEAQMNINTIISESTKYISTYVDHMNGSAAMKPRKFQENYGFSTLGYFHDILGLE